MATALVSVGLHALLVLAIGAWLASRPPMEDEEGPMEVVTVYDTAEDSLVPPESWPQPEDEVTPAEDPEDIADAEAQEEPSEEVEEEPEVAEENDPPALRDREALRSVHQPDRGSEAPDDPQYLAEVDNVAEEETVAEETAPEAGRGEEGEAEEPLDELEADVPDRPEADPDSAEVAAPVEEGEERAADAGEERVDDGASADPSVPDEAEVEDDEQRAVEHELEEALAVREEARTVREETAEDEALSPEDMVERLIVRDAVEDLPDPGVHSIARSAAAFDAESWANVFSLDDEGLRDRVAARERARGFLGDHEAEWEQLRRALENHDVRARAGRETSLNTRADAFAGYIHYLHDKIHARWPAYLRSLDFGVPADHPLSDRRLWVHLEMGISQHGEVVEVNVIRTSGQLTFDAQAIRIVQTIGPHRSPPQAMVSPDGNAWIHWRFHRDQRQCGTFGVDVRLLAAEAGDESSERQDRASRER